MRPPALKELSNNRLNLLFGEREFPASGKAQKISLPTREGVLRGRGLRLTGVQEVSLIKAALLNG